MFRVTNVFTFSNEGLITINSSMCDEIIDLEFSNDGQEANKQLVKRLLEEQDLYFNFNASIGASIPEQSVPIFFKI